MIASERRTRRDGVGLIVTANLDHVVRLRRDAAFALAYARAEVVVADGFPVHYYARLRGVPARRITGCELAARLMRDETLVASHRLFFVIDSEATEQGLRAWADARGLAGRVASAAPPVGFERDAAGCADLARRIAGHGTTILIMGVGAPRSEVFVDAHRAILPPCWALCVGQAIKIEIGLVRRAPAAIRALHGEWLWRLLQEPRRLAGRYLLGAVLFLLAIAEDLAGRRRPLQLVLENASTPEMLQRAS